MYDLQFVDTISASPTVRLDLMGAGWTVLTSTKFGMPELRRAVTSTLLTDGETYPSAAYSNRTITLVVRIGGDTDDDIAALLQSLMRELDRPSNLLLYRPDTTEPVFFRTFRTGPDQVFWDPFTKELTAQIPAEPFGYGLREDLPQVTVYADPAEGATLNSNPNFETDASNWSTVGGSIARSTAQFHEGVASLLLTPDGVSASVEARSETVTAAAGQSWRSSAWVRCAAARSVFVGIIWRDSGGSVLSTVGSTVAVAATTWTLIDSAPLTAPALTASAQIIVAMGSTPPGSATLHIDEARLRRAGGVGGCCWDIADIKGDVETPLYVSISSAVSPNFITSDPESSRTTAIAVRRRGNPAQAPFVLQAEAMSVGADTTLQAYNAAFSGSGTNWSRTTFATISTMTTRLSINPWPSGADEDYRGTYRVFMRYRSSILSPGVMQARLRWGTGGTSITNDTVDLIKGYGGAGGPYILYADLGVLQFPMGYDPITDGPDGVELPVEGMAIAIEAARVSGAASLDIDHLVFVPADDRLLLATWPASPTLPAVLTLDSDRGQVYVEGSAGGVAGRFGAQLAGGPPMVSPSVTNRVTWVRDVGTTSSTGSGAQGDEITSSTVLDPYYWPRYLAVRPPTT